MSHRKNNNVGYNAIFPMSNGQDDTFCHYCGRKASLTIRLEWDHVPALNVKVPIEQKELYPKTLIRSCQECNGLASDIPHLDYLERHFWLKAAYLRRYKRLLLSIGPKDVDTANMSGYLKAAVQNYDFMYKEILKAIGFGIRNINYIDSPILKLKNIDGKALEDVLLGFLYGEPFDNTDDSDESCIDENDENISCCSFSRFIDFLLTYRESGTELINQSEYDSWVEGNKYFFELNELPKKPTKIYQVSWVNICKILEVVISHTKRKHKITDYFIESLKNEFDHEVNNEYCNYKQFVEVFASEQIKLISVDDYFKWYKANLVRAKRLLLPNHPTTFYGKCWNSIYLDIIKAQAEINDFKGPFNDEITELKNEKVKLINKVDKCETPKKSRLPVINEQEVELFKKKLKSNFRVIESRISKRGTFWYKTFSYDIEKNFDDDYFFTIYSVRYNYQEFIAKVSKIL